MSIQQQWITTNMRFPSDLYTKLKIEAARSGRSVTSLVHERLRQQDKQQNTLELANEVKKLDCLAQEISQATQNISLSEKVVEMRYEQ